MGIGSPPSYPFAAEDFGLGLANVLVPGSIKGKIIYVDTAANGALDTNDGLSSGTAKLTISGALDACTNMMYDTIVIINYTASSEIEWPIAVDVQAVRIVQAPTGGWMQRYTGIDSVGDTACMTIDANFVHIEGIEFRAGASHGCIEFDTSGVLRPGLYNCTFGTGAYGVWTTGTGKPSVGLTVRGCHFVNALTSYGLYNQSDGPFYLFKDNTFDQLPSTGIYCQKGVAGRIISNRFALASGYSAGAAITIEGTNAQRCIIDDNRAGYGKDADGVGNANPYKDTCSQGTNHWFLNYKGITATEPATS